MKIIIIFCIITLGFAQINWESEIVDSMFGFTYDFIFNSMALDTNGVPSIVYNKGEFDSVIYASQNVSGWQKEIVECGVNLSYGYSLTFDMNNVPHMSYYKRYGAIDTTYLCYAWQESTGWQIDIVDTIFGYFANCFWDINSSIGVDTSGLPGIAYVSWNALDSTHYIKYAHYNGVTWDTAVVEYDSSPGRYPSDWCPSLRFDKHNLPHLAFYHCGGSTNDTLRYYCYDSLNNWMMGWSNYLGPTGGAFSLELALNEEGYPGIAYDYDVALTYSWWNGFSWSTDYIIDIGWIGVRICLDLDSYNQPHIAYLPDMPNRPYYCYKDSIWHLCGPIEVDTYTVTIDEDIALKVDNNNGIHAAYSCQRNNMRAIKYAKREPIGVEESKRKNSCLNFDFHIYPVPIKNFLLLEYYIPITGEIKLSIYDITGSKVKSIKQHISTPGWYKKRIDMHNLSSGVYFVKLDVDDPSIVRKAIFLK